MLMPRESLIAASVAGNVLCGWFKTTVLCILKHRRKKKKKAQGAWWIYLPMIKLCYKSYLCDVLSVFLLLVLYISPGALAGAQMCPVCWPKKCFYPVAPWMRIEVQIEIRWCITSTFKLLHSWNLPLPAPPLICLFQDNKRWVGATHFFFRTPAELCWFCQVVVSLFLCFLHPKTGTAEVSLLGAGVTAFSWNQESWLYLRPAVGWLQT